MKRKAIALTMCMTSVLLLGLSQCKKQETPITPTPEETEEGIYITLDVEDGGRHVVIPGADEAAVNYTFGDKIYVGDGSKYIGTLTNTGSTATASSHFEGIILSPSDGTTHLHFYFVGGLNPKNPEEPENPVNLIQGSTTSFAVDISNQSNNLPVLSYGNAPYVKGARDYSCMLKNKCGLVKFKFASNTMETVSVAGMLTQATISFSNVANPIVPLENQTPGNITLYSENEKTKWAILLPQASVDNAEVTIGTGTDPYYVTVPVITNNVYTSIINKEYVPEGNIIYNCGPVFSVGDDKFVSFSKGDLQCKAYTTNNFWRFAVNQWDYIGTHPEGETGHGTVNGSDNAKILDEGYTGWMDLFGWGTWGSNGNPLNISTESGNYTWSEFTKTLDGHNDWRTLSYDEWIYLLGERQSDFYAMVKCAWAIVNGVKGIVLLPDNWDKTIIVSNLNGWDNNVYYGAQFGDELNYSYEGSVWSTMENAGAIFLPAAGNRTVTTETTTQGDPPTTTTTTTINVNDAGSNGYYWISTSNTFTSNNYLGFDIYGVNIDNTTNPTFGCAVRLVRDIE